MEFYIDPDKTLTIEDAVASIGRRPRREILLVAGEFNADPANPEESASAKDISAALASARLEDMSAHILSRNNYWSKDRRTCSMRSGDRMVRSQTK